MLANELINLQETHDKFFEIDRLLEYLNDTLKELLQTRQSSIKIANELLIEETLIASYMMQLRVILHAFLKRFYRDDHSKKSAIEDLQLMTNQLL